MTFRGLITQQAVANGKEPISKSVPQLLVVHVAVPRTGIERIVPVKGFHSLLYALLIEGHMSTAVEIEHPHDMTPQNWGLDRDLIW
jgi:hypothetical protein